MNRVYFFRVLARNSKIKVLITIEGFLGASLHRRRWKGKSVTNAVFSDGRRLVS
jgi:hypothetical protein